MQKYLFTSILIASLLSIMDYRAPINPQKVTVKNRKPSLAKQIQMARIQKGFSHKYLARISGVAYDNLLAIESGVSAPTIEELYKIQEALGRPIVIDGDAMARM